MPRDRTSGYDRLITAVGLRVEFDCKIGEVAFLVSNEVIDNGGSVANASWIDGRECRCADPPSFSSSGPDPLGRVSTGDVYPAPWPMTELAVDDG